MNFGLHVLRSGEKRLPKDQPQSSQIESIYVEINIQKVNSLEKISLNLLYRKLFRLPLAASFNSLSQVQYALTLFVPIPFLISVRPSIL